MWPPTSSGRALSCLSAAGPDVLDVRRPDAPTRGQERREVEVHISVWRTMYPTSTIEFLEDETPPT